jgi:hypothetical protein
MLTIGHKSYIPVARIRGVYAIASHDRAIDNAMLSCKFVDATKGRRRKSKIVMDSGHVIVSAVEASVLAQRIKSA